MVALALTSLVLAEEVSERRVALVIGNDGYQHVPSLAQAGRDANVVSSALEQLDFEVLVVRDADLQEMKEGLGLFRTRLEAADVGFVYFAGHGIQFNGDNFLIPTDATLRGPEGLGLETLRIDEVLAQMHAAGADLNVVVLDACRNNPWSSKWRPSARDVSGSRAIDVAGLSEIDLPDPTFVLAFATAPDDVALDDGAYASQLGEHLTTPCTNLMKALALVETNILRESGQRPWTNYSGVAGFDWQPAGCTVPVRASVDPERPRVVMQPSASDIAFQLLPAGTFVMGSPEVELGRYPDEQQERRTVKALLVARSEITQATYEAVMGRNPSSRKSCAACPVEQVSFLDAVRFANALSAREGFAAAYEIRGSEVVWHPDAAGYRLPTEAEWEYAARAASGILRFAGSENLEGVGWVGGIQSEPVCTKEPNPFGLCDLTGNVEEWVWDGAGRRRSVRGGSYRSSSVQARVAYRSSVHPDSRYPWLGFRVVRNAQVDGTP
ncbi:MAG: SUMF1/EgtB/PvdO family nonheme iron enzyme [Myxococcales bacterium]|nr:SUMF1/EgtB/PvdO family nonheme iron enzyme [Myxococcales bacterium]